MADNTSPNEGYLARFFQRDSDTLGTWGNTGLMMFKIFHEWGDSYDPASGETGTIEGERYDAATDSFEPACTAGTPVFNGRLSGLWDCVAQAWPDDLAAMYRSMRAAGFNAEGMWELYQSFRGQWCEALYGADAMGYANTGRFDMAYGDKSEAMRQILRARFRYLDSKYGANTSAPLEFRLWGNGKGVALRYCCPLYASLNWGAGGVLTERATTPGAPSYFPNPGTTFNETTFTVYNADLLTEISTYAEQPDGTRTEGGLEDLATRCSISGLGGCRRLKRLVLDYSGREANTNLDGRVLEACRSVAMRRMAVRNCPNVTGHADFASQVIEEIDLRGTGVTGFTVPETDTLAAVRLGASVREIALRGLGGLTALSLEGTGELASLSVEECPKLDIRPILTEALAGDVLQAVKLTGVDWKSFGAGHLEKLADIGAVLTGEIALEAGANMTFALKQKCMAVWGEIDSESNPLRVGYTKRPVEIIRISGAGYYGRAGDYQLRVISDDPYANDFTRIEWSMTANSYAEIDTLTGRVRVSRTGTEELAPTAEVTVTVHKADGTAVSKTTTVGFYERRCRLGDFVYADGTYSDVYDDGRTIVCVCCYIDPDDPSRRLGMAPRAISGNTAYGADVKLTLSDAGNAGVDSCDVNGIPNINFGWETPAAGDILDDTEPDGFKHYPETHILRAGYTTVKADAVYEEGTSMPLGKLETAYIIRLRNRVLRDSGINLPVPVASGGETETECLVRLVTDADKTPGNAYRYYYPAASRAYAYEPAVKAGETLSPKFRAHQWFLPTPGDLQRFRCLLGSLDAFARVKALLETDFAMTAHTTGEHSNTSCCYKADVSTGNVLHSGYNAYGKGKTNAVVLPMVEF